MAILHKGSHTAGIVPAFTTVKERELVVNTADAVLYTSSDGIDVIKLGGSVLSAIDGGAAATVYLTTQNINGGGA